jgi:uncharacterized protein YndB with AHSA1/START domain
MTEDLHYVPVPAVTDDAVPGFATLTFERQVAAPVNSLWEAWTAPAARVLWASPAPSVEVEFLAADTRVGGREVSLCKVAGQPDIRCECGWLELLPGVRSVNYEVVSSGGVTQSSALVTAAFAEARDGSRIVVTVQLSASAADMEAGYQAGFGAGLENLSGVAERTMLLRRVIEAPRSAVWGAWMNPETLPLWWGPEGFSCHTKRIDLRSGGEWVFDMIGPDGTVYPNHHVYREAQPEERVAYVLLWGENGPKHADAWISFAHHGGATEVTLGMVFSSRAEFREAQAFGAVELGQQTLGKLARFVSLRAGSGPD